MSIIPAVQPQRLSVSHRDVQPLAFLVLVWFRSKGVIRKHSTLAGGVFPKELSSEVKILVFSVT